MNEWIHILSFSPKQRKKTSLYSYLYLSDSLKPTNKECSLIPLIPCLCLQMTSHSTRHPTSVPYLLMAIASSPTNLFNFTHIRRASHDSIGSKIVGGNFQGSRARSQELGYHGAGNIDSLSAIAAVGQVGRRCGVLKTQLTERCQAAGSLRYALLDDSTRCQPGKPFRFL